MMAFGLTPRPGIFFARPRSLARWLRERLTRAGCWPRSGAPLGLRGEQAAARWLRRRGYKIITTRHRSHYGEIDIIAVDRQTVVFVEVKTRRQAGAGRPAAAVDSQRQTRLTNAAVAFLKAHQLLETPGRFDVIEVIWPKPSRRPTINHLVNAFPAVGRGQMYC